MILLVQSSSRPQQHIATVPWYTSKECSSPASCDGNPMCCVCSQENGGPAPWFQRGCKFYCSILEAYLLRYALDASLEPVRRRCGSWLRADYRFGCNRMMTVPSKTLTNAALREPQPSSQFHDHFRIGDTDSGRRTRLGFLCGREAGRLVRHESRRQAMARVAGHLSVEDQVVVRHRLRAADHGRDLLVHLERGGQAVLRRAPGRGFP